MIRFQRSAQYFMGEKMAFLVHENFCWNKGKKKRVLKKLLFHTTNNLFNRTELSIHIEKNKSSLTAFTPDNYVPLHQGKRDPRSMKKSNISSLFPGPGLWPINLVIMNKKQLVLKASRRAQWGPRLKERLFFFILSPTAKTWQGMKQQGKTMRQKPRLQKFGTWDMEDAVETCSSSNLSNKELSPQLRS